MVSKGIFTLELLDYSDIYHFSNYISGENENFILGKCGISFFTLYKYYPDVAANVCYFNEKNVMFNDNNLKIKGYINWKNKKINEDNKRKWKNYIEKIELHQYYPIITVIECNNEKIKNGYDYMTELKKVMNCEYYGYYKGFYSGFYHNYECVTKTKLSHDLLVSKYINTFFSYSRDIIWNAYSKMQKTNFIFYGPSGTGKSSFVRRLSRALEIDLVYMDILRNYKYDMAWYSNSFKDIIVFNQLNLLVNKQKNDNSDFYIEDFVELLQDYGTNNGNDIIITIIEDYDYIFEKCPKLFKLSNVTYVKFDYMDTKNLEDLCLYHFGKTIDWDNNGGDVIKLNIPMSCIMDRLIDSKLYCDNNDDALDMFKNEIMELAKKYN